MIPAESKTENVIAAKKTGVSSHIVKPFNAATLKDQDGSGVSGIVCRRATAVLVRLGIFTFEQRSAAIVT
jgi:hypothetical protein